jgi:hypothetical protein
MTNQLMLGSHRNSSGKVSAKTFKKPTCVQTSNLCFGKCFENMYCD